MDAKPKSIDCHFFCLELSIDGLKVRPKQNPIEISDDVPDLCGTKDGLDVVTYMDDRTMEAEFDHIFNSLK